MLGPEKDKGNTLDKSPLRSLRVCASWIPSMKLKGFYDAKRYDPLASQQKPNVGKRPYLEEICEYGLMDFNKIHRRLTHFLESDIHKTAWTERNRV